MKVKNKAITLLLCILLLAGLLTPVTVSAGGPSESWQDAGIPDTAWYTLQTAEGKGATAANPYVIDTAEELAGLAALANAGNAFGRKFIRLDADIDLAGKNWVPIGSISNRFMGALDGNGHIVSNMTVYNENYSYLGLFGWLTLDPGTYGVRDLGVVNVDIAGLTRDTGALAGYVEVDGDSQHPVFENCFSTGSISSGGTVSALGGLFGRIAISNDKNCSLTIKNCYSSCDIAATNTDHSDGYTRYAGGLIAQIYNWSNSSTLTISNCYSASRVRTAVPSRTHVGGFVGHVNSATRITMTDCLFDTQAAGTGYGFGRLGVGFDGVEGRLTSAMTGADAPPAGWDDGSIWLAEAGMYPRLQKFAAADGSLASAIPLFLHENAGFSDTRANVRRSFTVPDTDGAEWSADPTGILAFDGTLAALTSPAMDTEVKITAALPSGARQTYTVLCKSGVDPADATPPVIGIGTIVPSDFSASIPITSSEAADIYVLALPAADDEPEAEAIVADARTKKGGGTAFTAEVGTLAQATNYVAYAVAVDPTGNVSDVESKAFTTQQDHTPPSWQNTGSMTISDGTVYFDCTYIAHIMKRAH